MKFARSNLALVTLALTLMAYVPVCCCWTETVATWMAGGVAGACGHVCCGHHGGHGSGHGSGHGDLPAKPDEQRRAPGHVDDCVCGVQHRIAPAATLTVLDFEPQVTGRGEAECSKSAGERAGRGCIESDDWVAAWGVGGLGSLLRLHCALVV